MVSGGTTCSSSPSTGHSSSHNSQMSEERSGLLLLLFIFSFLTWVWFRLSLCHAFIIIFRIHEFDNIFEWCSHTKSNHKKKVSQNTCVIERSGTKCLITVRLGHTMKDIIKRQQSQKVNNIKRQLFQNITSQNKNRHKTSGNH
jgi:hypothetical protein